MEMHRAMMEELNELYNNSIGHTTWYDTNVLASLHSSLENLFRVYGTLTDSGRSPSGAYEATSLTKP